jgi:undecaprenyl-phosphate galactose phosphotransferase
MRQEELVKLIYKVQPLVRNLVVVPNLVAVPIEGVEVESLFNERLMMLRLRNNLASPLNRWLKYNFDFTVTLVGTLVISPLLLLIALWIYYDSPGSVIFKHRRVGKDGKEFNCYKFRTMCVDAEAKLDELLTNDAASKAEWELSFKLKDDPRITRSGKFLRKTSLDELPQIFNVLKGEMSLVGPRPVVRAELERYGICLRDYLLVRPGITGMWQINGRSDTTYNERVQIDSWYVRNWSIWIDMVILFRTFKSVVKTKGAY